MKTRDVLSEDTKRTKGADALTSNLEAAKAVATIVKTTLGPMGMDKMLIDSLGSSIITNDGVKILKEMQIEHPGAKLLVEVAKTQESEVGDGTTSAVILSGELLEKAQELLEMRIHPNLIVRGYKKASVEALKILKKQELKVDASKEKVVLDVCKTAMSGKVAETSSEELSELLFKAISKIKDNNKLNDNYIKIVKAQGGNTENSFLFDGIVLDKNPAHPNMPSKIEESRILLIDNPLEIRELEADAKVNINSLQEYEAFLDSEKDFLENLVQKIVALGVKMVVCQKGIDDSVAYYLAKYGVLATRRTRKSDLEKLSAALTCPIVSSLEGINEDNLGVCKSARVEEILGEKYIFVESKDAKAVTLFLKGSTKHLLDEVERACDDAIGDLKALFDKPALVAGGGAVELELYTQLMNFAKKFEGKEQLIISAYASSFLSIPQTLCENCGLEKIDVMAELISKHKKGKIYCGINGFEGVVDDTMKEKIVEPVAIKEQAIKSATESSSMILRIDDIVAARRIGDESANSNEF